MRRGGRALHYQSRLLPGLLLEPRLPQRLHLSRTLQSERKQLFPRQRLLLGFLLGYLPT
jgi:hypothetical protein